MSKAYLTIDDAPSENFEEKVEFLEGKNIPAIFFCEGRYIEKRMEKVIEAKKRATLSETILIATRNFQTYPLTRQKQKLKRQRS